MKLSVILLTLTAIQVSASVYSQKTKFTLKLENVGIEKVLKEIQNNSEFEFLFNHEELSKWKNVNVDVQNATVDELLTQCLEKAGMTYEIIDKVIVLKPSALKLAEIQQGEQVTGKIIDTKGFPLPGVNIFQKGKTTTGTISNENGEFTVNVDDLNVTLVFSFVGFKTQEVPLNGRNTINVTLEEELLGMEEVVVTALGIKREEKSLGYAVTNVKGEDITVTKTTNVASNLSGRIPGIDITSTTNLGGSANVVIRGGSSLTGNNQALFVVDGVPISNRNVNANDQLRGGGGHDFGNFAADINPEDIESVSVLKGASATALYGSRGSNGVILITTKKGSKKDKIGVTFTSSVTIEKINKATAPKYQNKYGGGYQFENIIDPVDGQEYRVVQYRVDESWGPEFDPSIQYRPHWSWIPGPDYGKTIPWEASKNGPMSFFETGLLQVHSIALDGGSDKGTFRVSFTNTNQDDIIPESYLKKNALNFNGSLQLSDRLSTSLGFQVIRTDVRGRPGTGYDSTGALSYMASSAMWMQTNVDYERLKTYETEAGEHITWNRLAFDNPYPKYWDNPYWTLNKNYENDARNRIIGNWMINYKIAEGIDLMGRAAIDAYDFKYETRTAKGSHNQAFYNKSVDLENEMNYDLMLNFNKDVSDKINITGIAGAGSRRNYFERTAYTTSGGIGVQELWTISNTVSPGIVTRDQLEKRRVNSVYGQASIGFNKTLFIDLSARNDWSSTLPKDDNSYFYPSVSTSLIFSELVEIPKLTFGKLRFNWAKVGNDAPFASLYDTYDILERYNTPLGNFGTVIMYEKPFTLNNPLLKNETTTSFEAGMDLKFFSNRLGIDVSYYNKKSEDLIIEGSVSIATGYQRRFYNAGELKNHGFEVLLYGKPIATNNFSWDINVNWAKNNSEVLSLAPGVNTHIIGSNRVQIVAQVGQPYGTILGNDWVYDTNGRKLVDDDGFWLISDDNQILGDVNPDWRAGISNDFRYKNITLSTLIDMKIGGDIYSLTSYWGNGSGVLEESAGFNDKGNPVRDNVEDGGGILMEGVHENGSENTTYIEMGDYVWSIPEKLTTYDASYVKLRQVAINYSLPNSFVRKLNASEISIGVIGRNLAILHKNTKHFDPEATYGSGNIQGLEIGTLPSRRSYGFNLKITF